MIPENIDETMETELVDKLRFRISHQRSRIETVQGIVRALDAVKEILVEQSAIGRRLHDLSIKAGRHHEEGKRRGLQSNAAELCGQFARLTGDLNAQIAGEAQTFSPLLPTDPFSPPLEVSLMGLHYQMRSLDSSCKTLRVGHISFDTPGDTKRSQDSIRSANQVLSEKLVWAKDVCSRLRRILSNLKIALANYEAAASAVKAGRRLQGISFPDPVFASPFPQ